MRKQTTYIVKLRQSNLLRGVTFLFLIIFLAVPKSVVTVEPTSIHQNQRILPIDIFLFVSPGDLTKPTRVNAEFSTVVLTDEIISEFIQISFSLDQGTFEYSQTLTNSFIYTQTISSYL
jgi:hypothetical protein